MSDKDGDEAENLKNWRESKALLVVTVSIALFLDNILVSTVVPILPQYLSEIDPDNHYSTPSVLLSTLANESQINVTLSLNPNISTTDQPDKVSNRSVPDSDKTEEGLTKEGTKFGFLLGSKPLVQLIVNPFIGTAVYRFGYRRIMFVGFIILFLSTLVFAYGETYEILFFARSLQGLASSCSSVAGMAGVAKRFTDEKKRQNAMRITLGGIALGLSLGPPFGGASYQYIGKRSPFLILCGVTLIDGFLLWVLSEPKKNKEEEKVKQTSFITLVKDPYILIASAGVTLLCSVYTAVEATLPLHMVDTMHASRLDIGLVFVPGPICYVMVLNVIGNLCLRLSRWLLIDLGAVLSGMCLALFPLCWEKIHIVVPSAMMGTGAGMMQLALIPEFAHLVDIRHTPEYATVYAVSDVAVCVGLFMGPSLAGFVHKNLGLNAAMFGGAAICLMYVPLGYLLRNPPARNKLKDLNEEPTTGKLLSAQNSEKI